MNSSRVDIGNQSLEAVKKMFYKEFGKNAQEAKKIYEKYNLQNEVPSPCNPRKIDYRDFGTIMFQEGVKYDDVMRMHARTKVQISRDTYFKIPKILHHVWFSPSTDTPSDREIKFPKHNPFFEPNVQKTNDWTHYLWTNNLDYIPYQTKLWSDQNNVEVRNINDLANSDNNFAQKHHFNELIEKINDFIEQREFGMATDAARYLIMYLYGGIYADGDYRLYNIDGLQNMMRSYNSFFGREFSSEIGVGNAFLAAEPENVVISKTIEFVERNLLYPVTAPEYVNYATQNWKTTLAKTGPITLSMALYSVARDDQDVILPFKYVFTFNYDITPERTCKHWSHPRLGDGTYDICRNVGIIGDHLFAGTWLSNVDELDFSC